MKALLDGDIVAFRCAAASENEDEGIGKYYVDKLVDDIILATGADQFSVYLSGPTNFRYQIYPEYKANRLDQPVPRHREALKNYLLEKYNAVVSENCEADDLMGIEQCSYADTIICTLDKDLLMIPGKHYSWSIAGKGWVKDAIFREIDYLEGMRRFYTQVLTGDTSDNIKGCPGIGKVKAERILSGCETEQEMFEAVQNAYSFDEAFLLNAQVLWIQRQPNQLWSFPIDATVE